jgi:hypothetical protein
VGALCHYERHDAVDTKRGEQQGDQCESAKERRVEPIAGHPLIDDLVHRSDVGHGQIGIDGSNDGGKALLHRGRLACGANSDRGARSGALGEWDVNLRESVDVLGSGVSHMARNPDDLPFHGGTELRHARDQLLDGEALFQGFRPER